MGVVNGIFLNLCQLIYPIIPKLYDLVIQLATIDLFDPNNDGTGLAIRNNIWNNLYIILSVLVLFAIAIKLINAIVNPDVLSDKKNGVKKAYFKAVAAVFLIVLLPMLFNLLQGVQNEIIEKDFIQKIIYGDIRETNPGQRLAVETARSFVEMADGVEDPFPGEDQDLNDDAISQILNTLEDNNAHKDDDGEYVKSFNPLLMLVSGVFVVYQLILIVLDVAVRTIKLRILELMVPAIIGGYIFKTEILKSWFKEYIKTFVQVFLLLITITLISLALGLLKSATSEQFTLLVRLLLIFGVLTLAKQIPNLINTIFGTNIKGKGGIKGRAGEMAAVGSLAQSALGALKPLGMGALKLAGLVGLGAGGIAAGAVGAGVGIAGKRWWNKGIGGSGPGKNTRFGRTLRTLGTGAKAIGTGASKAATKKGGLISSASTLVNETAKVWKDSPIGKQTSADRLSKRRTKVQDAHGITDRGTLKEFDEIDKASTIATNNATTKKEKDKVANIAKGQRKAVADNKFKGLKESTNQAFKGEAIDKAVRDLVHEYGDSAALYNSHGKIAKSKRDAMGSTVSNMIAQAGETLIESRDENGNPVMIKKADAISEVWGKFNGTGQYNTDKFLEEIGKLGVDSGKLGQLTADANSYKMEMNAVIDSDGNTYSKLFAQTEGGGINIAEFGKKVGDHEKDAKTIRDTIDVKLKNSGADEETVGIVQKELDSIDTVTDSLAQANSKYDSSNDDQREAYKNYDASKINSSYGFVGSSSVGGSTSNGGSTSSGGSTSTPPSPSPAPAPEPAPSTSNASTEGSNTYSPGPAPDYWGMATGATANTSGPAPDYWGMQQNGAPTSQPIDVAQQSAQSTTTTNVINETKTEINTETRRESSGEASYDSGSSSDSRTSGSGSTTVNATIDTRGIESKLDEINRSVNRSGESVSSAVNEQGKQITSRLDQANTYQKKTSEAAQNIKDNIDRFGPTSGSE